MLCHCNKVKTSSYRNGSDSPHRRYRIGHFSIAYFLWNMSTKNYWDPTTLARVTTKMWESFMRHSVLWDTTRLMFTRTFTWIGCRKRRRGGGRRWRRLWCARVPRSQGLIPASKRSCRGAARPARTRTILVLAGRCLPARTRTAR